MLQKGERTGELKIVDGNNVSGAFGNILSNNRYAIAAGGADGTIVVVGTASADDVAGTTGNRNNRNAAAAWDSAAVAADTAAGAVKSILNDASQFDTARYARNLTLVAPTDSNLALMTARELNDRIGRGVRNRLNAGRRPSAWAESFGDYARQDGNFDGVGFNARTVGFMFGADGEVDDGVSVGAGYVFSRTDADFGGRDTDIGGHAVFAYAEYSPDAFFVRGGLSYNYAEYKEKATVENIAVSSDYDIWTLGAEAAAGYRFANGVAPEAELRYTYLMPENYTDSLGQGVHQNNARMLTAAAVFHVRPDYGGAGVRPTADLGVSYDLMEPCRKAGVSIGGAGYEIRNRKMPRLGAEGGVGVDFTVGGWDFSAGYDFSVREDYRSHAGKLKVRRDF